MLLEGYVGCSMQLGKPLLLTPLAAKSFQLCRLCNPISLSILGVAENYTLLLTLQLLP